MKEELFEWKVIIDRWEDINWNVRCSTRNRIKLIEFYYRGTSKVIYIYIREILILWRISSGYQDKDKVVVQVETRFSSYKQFNFPPETPVYKATWGSELGWSFVTFNIPLQYYF